ncbi:MAG: universal stress protein [bacterium]
MFKKMLVATDGSERAMRACSEAGRMARALGSELTLLYVVYVPPLYTADIGPGIMAALVNDGKRILDESKKMADASGIEAGTKLVREGDPARMIVKEAEAGAHDLIVMGGSGLGRAGALALGSVSNRVSHDSRCSVLIVK